jgi:hypothetical protein
MEREEFSRIIDKLELAKKMAEIQKRGIELFNKKQEAIPDTEIEQEIEQPCIQVSCKKCNGIIKVPITPNLETDRYEKLASGIYTAFIQDVEAGISFCKTCEDKMEQEGLWKTDAIINWLNENKGTCLAFSKEDFCKEFRNDGQIVSGMSVKYKLDKLEMPIQIIVKADEIRMRVD